MQLADSPRKVALAFAKNGNKDTIPEDSSPSAGRASMNDGFPPETRQPVGSGGIPPNGLDMNGILYYLSLLNRWQSASGGFVYDSVFANDADVGGYPKGAILLRSDGEGFWLNLADNNVNNPDTGGANWQPINNVGITSKTLTGSDVTLTNAEAAKDIIVLSGTLTANVNLIMPVFVKQWIVANNTSGAFTVTVKTASGTGGLVTQGTSRVFYGDGTNVYGVNPLAATQAQVDTGTDTLTFLTPKTFNDAQQFVDIDTELSNKADLNGNAAQEFAVATATTGNSAVNKAQFDAKTSLATTTQAGIVEKATQAEMNAGAANVWPDAATIFNGFSLTSNTLILPEFMGSKTFKWGQVVLPDNTGIDDLITVTFPQPFPDSLDVVLITTGNTLGSGRNRFILHLASQNTSGFTAWYTELDNVVQAGFINWFAIGK